MNYERADREFQIRFLEKKLQELQNAHDPGAARLASQLAGLKSVHQQMVEVEESMTPSSFLV